MPNSNPDDPNVTATTTNGQQNGQNTNVGANSTTGDPDFASMNERERALVTRARAEEKRKLYKRQREQEERIAELERSLRDLQNAPPPRTTAQADSQDTKFESLTTSINALVEESRRTQERIQQMEQNESKRRRDAELRAYAQEQINIVRQNGNDLIAVLVGGDSEEEIDDSIKVATAEYQFLIQQHENKTRAQNQNNNPTSVTVQSGNGRSRPQGTPPVQVPNSVEADSNQENIDDITSQNAVRDGSYAKNRTQLLGRLRRGYKYTGPQQAQ